MLTLLEVGSTIAPRRKGLSLTQTDLAQKAGLSRPTIAALENGRAGELGYTKVSKILEVLGLQLQIIEAKQRRPTLDELHCENNTDADC